MTQQEILHAPFDTLRMLKAEGLYQGKILELTDWYAL